MTNAELAILSLIAEHPSHGYDIEQTIETRGMRDWSEIGFSSIYYLLRKLEKEGLVNSELVPSASRGPGKKVYRVTPAGKAVWQEEALVSLSSMQLNAQPLLLGLSNLPGLPAPRVIAALELRLQRLLERFSFVKSRYELQGAETLPQHVQSMFKFSLGVLQYEIDFVQDLLTTLKKEG